MALLAAEHPHAIAAPHKTAAAIMNMKPRNIEALLYVGLIYAPEGCRCAAIAKNIQ